MYAIIIVVIIIIHQQLSTQRTGPLWGFPFRSFPFPSFLSLFEVINKLTVTVVKIRYLTLPYNPPFSPHHEKDPRLQTSRFRIREVRKKSDTSHFLTQQCAVSSRRWPKRERKGVHHPPPLTLHHQDISNDGSRETVGWILW